MVVQAKKARAMTIKYWLLLIIFIAAVFVIIKQTIKKDDTLSLRSDVIETLLATQSEFIYIDAENQIIAIYCTTSEGSGCFYVPASLVKDWKGDYQQIFISTTNRLSSNNNDYLVNKMIAYAPGYVLDPGVALRCRRSIKDLKETKCEVYEGNSWKYVKIED